MSFNKGDLLEVCENTVCKVIEPNVNEPSYITVPAGTDVFAYTEYAPTLPGEVIIVVPWESVVGSQTILVAICPEGRLAKISYETDPTTFDKTYKKYRGMTVPVKKLK
jgi:hypothetical protein